jgi:hypothetical protein
VAGVLGVQYAQVGVTNFGGADEWLYLDLTSRGVLGIPYANRPLVLLWHAPPASLFPGDLRAFWAFTVLYLGLTGLLTAALARRLAPEAPLLAVMAGVFACAWAPLDYLRLDTVLICGYAGFTFAAVAALVLFVESWHRERPSLLAFGIAAGVVAALGVESVLPVLATAPLLVFGGLRREPRRFAGWVLAWAAGLAVGAALTLGPLLLGRPSYQTGALGLDPSVLGVGRRLLQLLSMQAGPLLTSPWSEMAAPTPAAAVLIFAAGGALAARGARRGGRPEPTLATVGRTALLGLVLAVAAHAALALTPEIKTPARTQVLSAPGFALALAAVACALAAAAPRRLRAWVALAIGSWVVAVGTGRVVAMQADWDASRSAYPRQRQALAGLIEAAPALRSGTLVLMLDGGDAFPIGFTFRHAVAYLYGPEVVGVAAGTPDFLYPWSFTPEGVVVAPWPVIRGPWGVAPTRHPWETLVVVRRHKDGTLDALPRWPEGELPSVPAGASYTPASRVLAEPVRGERRRRALEANGRGRR